MAISTTTTLSNSVHKFTAPARLKLKQTGVSRRHVDNVTLPKGMGLTYNEPQISFFSVIGLTEGTDLSQAQTVSDTNVAVTVAQAGGQVVITDLAVEALADPIMQRIGEGLANAYSNYVDNDVTTLFAGLDASMGATGTTFAPGYIRAGMARLMNTQRVISGPIVSVLHPYHWDAIAQDIAGTRSGNYRYTTGTPSVADTTGGSAGNGGVNEQVWRKGIVDELYGCPIAIDPTISVSSNSATSAIFARDALIYIQYMEPDMEIERDASLRASELNYVGTHGKGEREGTWGFSLVGSAATPTA